MKATVKNDEIKTYELGYLLSPLVAPDQAAETVEKEIKKALKTAKAEIKSEIPPQQRSLAYPIKKVVEHKGSIFREAYFGSVVFTCEAEQIPALEASLKKSALLIRHLLVILPARALLAPAKPRVAPVEPAPAGVDAVIDQEIDNLIKVA